MVWFTSFVRFSIITTLILCETISKFSRSGYDRITLQRTACFVVDPFTVGHYAFLFNCATTVQVVDSMTTPVHKPWKGWYRLIPPVHRPVLSYLQRCFLLLLWLLQSHRVHSWRLPKSLFFILVFTIDVCSTWCPLNAALIVKDNHKEGYFIYTV